MTERCAAKVWHEYHQSPCSSRGKYEEDGRWWCGTHAPSKVKARDAERARKYREKMARREAARWRHRLAKVLSELTEMGRADLAEQVDAAYAAHAARGGGDG
jgi:hypothetical protein